MPGFAAVAQRIRGSADRRLDLALVTRDERLRRIRAGIERARQEERAKRDKETAKRKKQQGTIASVGLAAAGAVGGAFLGPIVGSAALGGALPTAAQAPLAIAGASVGATLGSTLGAGLAGGVDTVDTVTPQVSALGRTAIQTAGANQRAQLRAASQQMKTANQTGFTGQDFIDRGVVNPTTSPDASVEPPSLLAPAAPKAVVPPLPKTVQQAALQEARGG